MRMSASFLLLLRFRPSYLEVSQTADLFSISIILIYFNFIFTVVHSVHLARQGRLDLLLRGGQSRIDLGVATHLTGRQTDGSGSGNFQSRVKRKWLIYNDDFHFIIFLHTAGYSARSVLSGREQTQSKDEPERPADSFYPDHFPFKVGSGPAENRWTQYKIRTGQ